MLYYIEVFIFIARRIPLEKKYTLTKAILVLIFLLSAASVGFVAQPYTAINCILISLCLGGIGYYCTKVDIVKAAIGLLLVLLASFYIGIKLYGVTGVILGPVGMVIIFSLCRQFIKE